MTQLRDQLQSSLSGSYTLERELGGGGMSRVFVAEESRLGRRVVVKVLSPELAAALSNERFEREIRLAASLQQANIVPVLTAGETGGIPYYTMPFVEGESLRARLERSTGPLPLGEVFGVLRDVAKALAYAHEHGVVHRDIKPDNILLSGGTAVVTDFGIAKAIQAARTDSGHATLTQVGTSIGTPAYMAPEQAAGDAVDHRADIYALGCVAYELLAGQAPFAGRTPQRMLAAHMSEVPKAVHEIRLDTPERLARLVMQCLEKEVEKRPASATELLQEIEAAVTSGATGEAAMVLLHPRVPLWKALGFWAAAAIAVPIVARAAVIAIGLPDWVFPGSLLVMLLGLPVILATHFVHRTARKALTMTPAVTPGGTPVSSTMTSIALKASPHLTWRRTTLGGALAVGTFAVLVAVWMMMRMLGIGPAGSLMAAGVMGERERIVVADFKSPANDTSLGPVLTEALRADLAQSRNLEIMQPTAVRDVLVRMQRPANERVDYTLAREVATREGIKAVLDGEVIELGGRYVITARLIATMSGDVLGSFRTTADNAASMIPAIGSLAKDVRAKVGESLKSVQAALPLEHVTTASLEALRKYVAGSRASDLEGNNAKAISLLREAVTIDTTFASAWRKLAVVLSNAGMPDDQIDTAAARAYRFRDRLSFVEQQMAIAYYHDQVVGDRQKQIAAYEAIMERDSMNPAPMNNLAIAYASRREFARAERLLELRLANNPIWQNFNMMVSVQFAQGRIAEAESTWKRWERELPSPQSRLWPANFAYARGQLDSAHAIFARNRFGNSAQSRVMATFALANLAALRGRIGESQGLRHEALAADRARTGDTAQALNDSLTDIVSDVWFREQRAEGVRRLDAALMRHPLGAQKVEDRPYLFAAQIYALAGRGDKARGIMQEYQRAVRDTARLRRQQTYRHIVLGEIALAEGDGRTAVTEFRLADQLPDGPSGWCGYCTSINMARAFDLAGVPDSAIARFEEYLTMPGPVRVGTDAIFLAGAYKRLGELYEARGERQKALGSYLKFVELWKNADPELQPRVREVRARIERLRDTEAGRR
jgi:eukaryotic-like serine/threonine-protein kinase